MAFPIVLTPIPVPNGTTAATWDELIQTICQYVQGNVSATVSFFLQGTVAPNSNQGIFFNITNNRFETWNVATGAYIAISDFVVGDMKATLLNVDNTANGWVVMNGRTLTSIAGLTQIQFSNLQTLFGTGTGATLPNYSFTSALSGLPPQGTFSAISAALSAWTPAVGVVAGLTVNNPPTQADVQGIQNALEHADDSGTGVQTALTTALSAMELVLDTLSSAAGVTGPVWCVFVGYP
jgi:hypothetical protein